MVSWNKYLPGILFLILLLHSCGEGVSIRPGLYPLEIRSDIKLKSTESSSCLKEGNKVLVVVIGKNIGLVEMKTIDTSYERVFAFLFNAGRNVIPYPQSSKEADVYYISRGCYTIVRKFKAGLGIGSFIFDPSMEENPNWENDFFTNQKLFIQSLVDERTYRIDQKSTSTILSWYDSVSSPEITE